MSTLLGLSEGSYCLGWPIMLSEALELAEVRKWARDGRARAIREQAGLSRAEIARDLGVHETTIQKWEAGERSPRERRLALTYGRLLRELEGAES